MRGTECSNGRNTNAAISIDGHCAYWIFRVLRLFGRICIEDTGKDKRYVFKKTMCDLAQFVVTKFKSRDVDPNALLHLVIDQHVFVQIIFI